VSIRRAVTAAMAAAAALVLTGCGDASSDEVGTTARAFAAPDADPATRCALLTENTRAALVQDEGSPCEEAIADIPVGTGDVVSVEVWGTEAQVKLGDDTLFLTQTSDGWRVSAAACRAQGSDEPYECQVEA
jgi:hypothetical protein